MQLPPGLSTLYQGDHNLDSFVGSALSRVENHIDSNPMVFFPEYTDHGIHHLELTLQTAWDLATQEARQKLTGSDGAVLAVAVALHDFALHLTRDGFSTLVSKNSVWTGVNGLDEKPWSELWDDFYTEATRFDDRQLRLLFGDHYRPVRPLPPDSNPWEDFDYLLVGEFLRRYHSRLAHEIALNGLPGARGKSMAVCRVDTEENRFLADLSGLVARSHGTDLRRCLDYLTRVYENKIDPRRIHAAFLAVLLRIADYFQIQPQRAPTARTDVVAFKSALSEREWRVHQSVRDIHNTSGDPEAIVVNASPPDVESFLRLRQWLEGLQVELDRSWAILGEVYGLQRHNELDRLGLRIRRVKSNTDDLVTFTKAVAYVPAKVAFEAANANLLKLLVGPLYGDDAGIGIRELLQNSVDAVREFDYLLTRRPDLKTVERLSLSADIELRVTQDEAQNALEISILDRGIGMTSDTVRDYFLKAGASFRKSDAWRRDYEDTHGHSQVLRTGRFGIGALAAFLLGDEIEVTTRHVLLPPDEGVKFSARLDSEFISLARTTCPAGTQIKVTVPDRLQKAIGNMIPNWNRHIQFHDSFGHYFLKFPSVARIFSSHTSPLTPERWLPQPDDGASVDWRCFHTAKFEKVHWTYQTRYPAVSCNGLVVELHQERRTESKISSSYIKVPKISVFDRDGYLPLTLQRTGLAKGLLPFDEELQVSIAEDILAFAIAEGPKKCEGTWLSGSYPGFTTTFLYHSELIKWAHWLVTKRGFLLNDRHLIATLRPTRVIIGVGGKAGYQDWGERLRRKLLEGFLLASAAPQGFSGGNPRIKGLFRDLVEFSWQKSEFDVSSARLYVPEALLDKIEALRPGQYIRRVMERLRNSDPNAGWYSVTRGPRPPSSLGPLLKNLSMDENNPMIFFEAVVSDWKLSKKSNVIAKKWLELVGTPLVPFEGEARADMESRLAGTSAGEYLKLYRSKMAERRKPQLEEDEDYSYD